MNVSMCLFIRACERGISVNVRNLCHLFINTNLSDTGLLFDMRMLQEGMHVFKLTKLRLLLACTCACAHEHLQNCAMYEPTGLRGLPEPYTYISQPVSRAAVCCDRLRPEDTCVCISGPICICCMAPADIRMFISRLV